MIQMYAHIPSAQAVQLQAYNIITNNTAICTKISLRYKMYKLICLISTLHKNTKLLSR